jgi:hypothetical protein
MGEMKHSPRSVRLTEWLVDRAGRLLEPDERDVVCGDLTESGANSLQALSEVLGLVARRQAEFWLGWRPWLGFLSLVVPAGLLLSVLSRSWADSSAIHWWFYVNNWTHGYLESSGARSDLVNYVSGNLLTYLCLLCWSWTTGFVLGSVSSRTIGVNGFLFCLAVFAGTLGTTSTARINPANAEVFQLSFYGVWFPWIVRTFLVVIPALSGMRTGFRRESLPLLPAILWVAFITTLKAWDARGLEYGVIFGWVGPHVPHLLSPGPDGMIVSADDVIDWRVRLLPLVIMWPACHMVASAGWRHWRARDA